MVFSVVDFSQGELEDLDDFIRIAGDGCSRSTPILETDLGDHHTRRAIIEGHAQCLLQLRFGVAANIGVDYSPGNSHA